ncbi:MAG: HDOD domain-containing protein [Candidatus Krumholzibacteriota bacterium]|nr:HDOD domain-containing protein [Candidatus Krumholzibacteriota bacterium]
MVVIDPGNPEAKELSVVSMEKVVSRMSDLPTLPNTLMKIWMLLESADSSSKDLEKVISLDQSLSAKILRLANSPFYHIPQKVNNVSSAIVNVGFETIKNLVITVSVTSVLKKLKSTNKYFPLKEFWRHSASVGVVARAFAKKVPGVDSELCFCAGVLHDIGKFVLNILYPNQYAEAISLAAVEKNYIHLAERDVFSFDHAKVGEVFARYWQFSNDLRSIIGSHHKELSEVDDEVLMETAVVQIADALVRNIPYGFPGDFMKGEYSDHVFELFDINIGFIEEFQKDIMKDITSASEILNLV